MLSLPQYLETLRSIGDLAARVNLELKS